MVLCREQQVRDFMGYGASMCQNRQCEWNRNYSDTGIYFHLSGLVLYPDIVSL